jgi:hypothetical protein
MLPSGREHEFTSKNHSALGGAFDANLPVKNKSVLLENNNAPIRVWHPQV